MSTKKIAVILEAAGDAKRFGSNKLLHPMEDGSPMIGKILSVIRTMDDSDCFYSKIMVTQYYEVAELASDFAIVRNEHPEYGISHSMQLGIEAAGDPDAYMFCVCDQPGIQISTIERLIRAYEESGAGIVSLSWKGKMCNPKIFSAKYKEELMSLSGDTGGRQIIKNHTDDLLLVEADNESEVIDIDINENMESKRTTK